MKRRLISLLMALSVLATVSIPALATDTLTNSKTEVEVTVDGSIKNTKAQMRVTVPTSIEFSVDPGVSVETEDLPEDKVSATAQVTQPEVNITNYSPFDIFIGINDVGCDGVELTSSVDLLSDEGDPYLFFDLYAPNDPDGNDPPIDYTKSTERCMNEADAWYYYALNEEKGRISKDAEGTGYTVPLYVCARAAWGAWEDNQTFTISPTIIVSSDSEDWDGYYYSVWN